MMVGWNTKFRENREASFWPKVHYYLKVSSYEVRDQKAQNKLSIVYVHDSPNENDQ